MSLNLIDIVIDTNVFVHAQNPEVNCSTSSRELLKELLNSNTLICVDKSKGDYPGLIEQQYQKHIRWGSFGFDVLAKLLREQRLLRLDIHINKGNKRFIERLIKNRRDRTFIFVAYNSNDNVLVSQDFNDFSRANRELIKKRLYVKIPCSGDFFTRHIGNCNVCSK